MLETSTTSSGCEVMSDGHVEQFQSQSVFLHADEDGDLYVF